MDKMQLLKSVIGTLGIYLIFSVFTVIFYLFLPYHGDPGIGGLANVSHMIFYYTVCLPLCGIAGALLFKGKIPVWLWTAATVLFTAAMTFITGGNTSGSPVQRCDSAAFYAYSVLYRQAVFLCL